MLRKIRVMVSSCEIFGRTDQLLFADEFGDRLEAEQLRGIRERAEKLPELTSEGFTLQRKGLTVNLLRDGKPASKDESAAMAKVLNQHGFDIRVEQTDGTGNCNPAWTKPDRVGSVCWFIRIGSAVRSVWLQGIVRAWVHTSDEDGCGWPSAVLEEVRTGRVFVVDADGLRFSKEQPEPEE